MTTFDDFQKLDIRVGKIKVSGARVVRYVKNQLIGKLVLGVVNLPPRQIGKLNSETLTLGVPDANKECILISPDSNDAVIGGKLY
ncbi:MAG: hypothetical protein WAP23_01340 [Candidatus Spechtbacterales bacterium]